MRSDETAITIPGGPRVIDVFDGNGGPSGRQIGSWWPLGVGLVVGSPLDRIRRRCGSLVLSESPGSETSAKPALSPWPAERNRLKMLEATAHAA